MTHATQTWIRLALAAALAASAAAGAAQTAHFALDGQVVAVSGQSAVPVAVGDNAVSEVFGTLPDGRLVVGVGALVQAPSGDYQRGLSLQLVDSAGATAEVAADVLRAYPAPTGARIAFLGIDHGARLWDGERVIDLPIAERVTQLSWFPDGQAFAFTGFPPDWSPGRLNNAPSDEEFLRLNDPDIFRFDLASGAVTPLVVRPGPDWSPAVAPDGRSLVFNGTIFGTTATLSRLDLATGLAAPLGAPVRDGGWEDNLPPALTGQLVWTPDGERVIYATTRPETNAHEIIAVRPDGSGRTVLGAGTRPQVIADGSGVAFLRDDGAVAAVTLPREEE